MARDIAIWGLTAMAAALVCWILAFFKNRDMSVWVAWGFLFPPAVLLLAFLPRLPVRPRRPTLDEQDSAQARADGY